MGNDLLEKLKARLSHLYLLRYKTEMRMLNSLRYTYDVEKHNRALDDLAELRGRIWEIETILTAEDVSIVKKSLTFPADIVVP